MTVANGMNIDRYLDQMGRIASEISREAVDAAIEILFDAWRHGNTVFVMGNGGSASTATHLACDLAKYTIVGAKPRFRGISLNDNIPLGRAGANDGGFRGIFAEQLRPWLGPGDVLIGNSLPGRPRHVPARPW